MAKGGEGGFRLVFGGCRRLGRVWDFAHNGRRLPVYSKPCCGSIWLFQIVKRRIEFWSRRVAERAGSNRDGRE